MSQNFQIEKRKRPLPSREVKMRTTATYTSPRLTLNSPRKMNVRASRDRYKNLYYKAKKSLERKGNKSITVDDAISSCSQFLSEDEQFLVSMLLRHADARMPWSNAEKDWAMALFYRSPAAYHFFLEKKFHLPSASSIRRWRGEMDLRPGISQKVLSDFKNRPDLELDGAENAR